MARRLNPETLKIIEAMIEQERGAGSRKVAIALELLLAWYKESVEA